MSPLQTCTSVVAQERYWAVPGGGRLLPCSWTRVERPWRRARRGELRTRDTVSTYSRNPSHDALTVQFLFKIHWHRTTLALASVIFIIFCTREKRSADDLPGRRQSPRAGKASGHRHRLHIVASEALRESGQQRQEVVRRQELHTAVSTSLLCD